MEKPREPRWVPYSPPPPDWKARMWSTIKRHSFAGVCVVLAAGLAGFLWIVPELRSGTSPAEALSILSAEVHPSASSSSAGAYEGTSTLSISTQPAGARVILNGEAIGTTPVRGRSMPAGVYVLSLQKENYAAVDTIVALGKGETPMFTFALQPRGGEQETAAAERPERPEEDSSSLPSPKPAVSSSAEQAPTKPRAAAPLSQPQQGALRFTSEPADVAVFLDGQSVGRTPLTLSGIATGTHTVTLRQDGYQPHHEEVSVAPGQRRRVHGELTQENGTLRVLARPWASIYIDGALHARNTDLWYAVRLPAGTHRVEVVHPSLGTQERTVVLKGRGETSVVFNLAPSTGTDGGGLSTNDDSAGVEP